MPTASLELALPVPPDLRGWAVADLAAWGFDGFVEDDDALRAYIAAPAFDGALRARLDGWLRACGLPADYATTEIPPTNWNAAFEASVPPIAVPPFLVRPSWRTAGPEHAGLTDLVVDPKMSFGTGQHESTRLVLGLLPDLVRPGDRVLDAGTGTGILAIAALKLGAASALAFDVDEWAESNARENFDRNGVGDRAEVRIGAVEVVPETGFDLVVANIHREVLLDLLPALRARLRPGGTLALAGLLRADADAMREATTAAGFAPLEEATEGAWWAWAGRLA